MSAVSYDALLDEAAPLKDKWTEWAAARRKAEAISNNMALKDNIAKQSELRDLEDRIEVLQADADKFAKLHAKYHGTLKTRQEWDGQRYIAKPDTCPLCPNK